jgi:GT2 family glycosyltransferase
MSAPSVSVVIPTWNGRHLLVECLDGLARSTVAAETIVVDNGSTDGTAEWLDAAHPDVHVVRNPRNLGFAAGINQGIRATSGRWVAPLNNDPVPESDWLASLLRVGESYARIG